MSEIALTAKDINYQHNSLNDWKLGPIDLEFKAGELIGLIGPNGSGKSTLLSILAKALHGKGKIQIFGKDIYKITGKKWARRVAYLPQTLDVQYDFSVEETIAFGRFPYTGIAGLLNEYDQEVVERCIEEIDLGKMRTRSLKALSGGERQRVFLASILAQEPEIVFLDEPTTALDIHHQADFLNIIQKFCKRGMTVIMATHELTLAAGFCNKLVLLAAGKVVKEGEPSEVISQKLLEQVYGTQIKVVYPNESKFPVVIPYFSTC